MKENVIIINCTVPREAYQIFAGLRDKPKRKGFKIFYGALMKKDSGELSLEDGFAADGEEDEWGMMSALVGGLSALQGGSVGAMAAGGIAKMLGMGKKDMKGLILVLEKVSNCVSDGETFLLLAAKEKDEAALAERLEDFQISITRLNEKEIAEEIKHAKKSDKMEKWSESGTGSESGSLSETGAKIHADKIIKNAKIFTADQDNPQAWALVVKDGKFVYVGDEAGISEYEGEVTDLGGKFIMPGIFDTHVHITTGVAFEYADLGEEVVANSKKEALEFMADYVSRNPGMNPYRFMLPRAALNGEELVKEDLDAFCPDSELVILEEECHSVWVNSKMLETHGITDDTPDPVPELAYYVRKDGHITGNAFEATSWPFLFDQLRKDLTEEQIGEAVSRWIDFSVKYGVSAVFDAGFPEHNDIHERIYAYLRELDRQGKLPVYVDGCYMLTNPQKVKEALEETKRFNREFTTEHMKVHTLKIIMDGTLKIETAAMVTPYKDTGKVGGTPFNAEEIADILKELNAAGLDLHVHCVGERSSRIILDGVELARKELGDSFRVKVTITHMWVQDDADLGRFGKLGVIANYTPAWHAGNMGLGCEPSEFWPDLIGEERSRKMFRSKTVWDSGALVTWSSDDVNFGDFASWNPYWGMEVGMTRWISEKTKAPEGQTTLKPLEPDNEKMNIEEMILGYTINGAKQLGVEETKGSIKAGKDADFLVFDQDLLAAEHEGFSQIMPAEVYFAGKRMLLARNR